MKLKELHIKNFRIFEEVNIELGNYNVFVGQNGSGKSTVLAALNVLFQERESSATETSFLVEEDFHQCNTDEPIEIVATFSDLSDEAQADLKDYVRLDVLRVAIVATFNREVGRAEVKQFGERLGIRAFALFFAAQNDREKVSRLKEIYVDIRKDFSELAAPGPAQAMTDALRSYESAHPELCEPLRSADNFYGARKGRLDPYIQWVYIPAVKDARAEQIEGKGTALGKLLARTVRAKTSFDEDIDTIRREATKKYQELLEENQSTLNDVSDALTSRLREWAHPNASLRLLWSQDSERSIRVDPPLARALTGESGFEGDVARLGHGLQRSFILAVLHELSQTDDASAPTLLLGVEEPELYQHPPQVKHLAGVLKELANATSQIIVTTHSHVFAAGDIFEDVRMFRRQSAGEVLMTSASYERVAEFVAAATGETPARPEGVRARLHQALMWSLSEMFFVNRVVLVEGPEDVAYISYFLHAKGGMDALRSGGVSIVPAASKSGMIQAIAIAKAFGVPVYPIWDCDGHIERPDWRRQHERDNQALMRLAGDTTTGAFPDEDIISDQFSCWSSELSSRVKKDAAEHWEPAHQAACNLCGQEKGIGKHSLYVSELLAYTIDSGAHLSGLETLMNKLTRFASA